MSESVEARAQRYLRGPEMQEARWHGVACAYAEHRLAGQLLPLVATGDDRAAAQRVAQTWQDLRRREADRLRHLARVIEMQDCGAVAVLQRQADEALAREIALGLRGADGRWRKA